MRTEPTHLESFLQERIKALETEVSRLDTELRIAKNELTSIGKTATITASSIRVSDPVFLEPIKYSYT